MPQIICSFSMRYSLFPQPLNMSQTLMCCDQKDLAEVMLHQFWPKNSKNPCSFSSLSIFLLFLPPMHVPLLSLSLFTLSPDAIRESSLN